MRQAWLFNAALKSKRTKTNNMNSVENFCGLSFDDLHKIFEAVIGDDHYKRLKKHCKKVDNIVDFEYQVHKEEHYDLPHRELININAPLHLNVDSPSYGLGFEVHIYGNGYVKFDNGNGLAMALKKPLEVYKIISEKFVL